MRHAMETRGGRFAFGVSAAGEVAGKEQRAHAGDVGLESQGQEIELKFDVLVESLRHTDRNAQIGGRDRRGLHGNLEPALDFADVLRIVVEPRAIGRAGLVAKTRETAGERIQNAAIALSARGALRGRSAVAEHALEDYLRIQFHGQGLSGRRPGDGVGVGAAVTFAAVAGVRAGVFDRELHGGHQVVLAELLRDELIDGGAG